MRKTFVIATALVLLVVRLEVKIPRPRPVVVLWAAIQLHLVRDGGVAGVQEFPERWYLIGYDVPLDKNPEIFLNTVFHNRLNMLIASALFIIFGLNNTRDREKFI